MLRHADIGTTLDLYTHVINKDKLFAQNQVMEAMMKPAVELTYEAITEARMSR